jgi:hypothetical protein
MRSARLDALPAARLVLEVVALAGSPVLESVAVSVAGLSAAQSDVVQQLEAERLLRSSGDGRRLEAWHDRIRELVFRAVEAERARTLHARLAEQLRAAPDADIDALPGTSPSPVSSTRP